LGKKLHLAKKKKFRFPPYDTLIGKGAEVQGNLRFVGGLHVDGKIHGDVIAEIAPTGEAAVSLSATGVIDGNLESPYVVLDGRVTGDVRASERAILAAGARIEGTLYYGALTIDEGAEIHGGLVPLDVDGFPFGQVADTEVTAETANQA
jgi:cytoskeletal protein CcmA (bactofilin family)